MFRRIFVLIENNLPLVTVIVPCYNHDKYVETCLDSIFKQTYQNIEVIVVDDCSPDGSVDVIKKLKQKYNFKFIEHQENLGLTKTLNDVIYKYAQGKYIKCIASDDYLTDDCIEVLTKEIETLGSDYAMAYGLAQTFAYDESQKVKFGRNIGLEYESFRSLFMFNNIPASSVLFSREHFYDVGGFDPSMFIEDYYLWLLFTAKYKIRFINKVVSFYYLNNLGSMSSKVNQMLSSEFELKAKVFMKNLNKLSIDDYLLSTKLLIGSYSLVEHNNLLVISKWKAARWLIKNYSFISLVYKEYDVKFFRIKLFFKSILPNVIIRLIK